MDRKQIVRLALVTIAATALILVLRHWGTQRLTRLQGPPSPDFAMKQLDGRPLRLSDYRGKIVLLDFWASWCTPCRDEVPRFVEWQSKYADRGLQVIGVAMDDNRADAEKFSREFHINYPVVAGSVEVADHYGGIFGLPANFVIARDGKIVSRYTGVVDLSSLEHELTTLLATP